MPGPKTNPEETLTPQEVAQTLKIAKNTVYELVKRGELPAFKVGNQFRFNGKDVESYKTGVKPLNPSSSGETAEPGPSLKDGFILCGQDILLDILAQRMENHPQGEGRVFRSYLGSYNGLHALYQGNVHAATSHLWDSQTDSYNLPFLPHVLPGTPLVVVQLAFRTVGFYVQEGNPHGLKNWSDLGRPGLTLVNRELGSGMRVLLDERLRLGGVSFSQVAGYEQVRTTHIAAAASVARGEGDYALGSEKAGRQVDEVDFIPLRPERYDLIFHKKDAQKPMFRVLLEVVQSAGFRQELESLGGYDVAETGRILLG